jgi:hypothetical protein
MKLKRWVAAAALLNVSFLATPVLAESEVGFSALEGVSAQALTPQEMNEIAGELNAYDIAATLTSLAAKVSNPALKANLLKLAGYNLDNAVKINAVFSRLGILTPSKSGQ